MSSIASYESLTIVLLIIVSLVALIATRLRISYTVALVIVGLILALQQSLKVDVTPELILTLFVPPLAFEAGFRLELSHLRANLPPIIALAVPGVILVTVIVAGLVTSIGAVPLTAAIVFGALISATDPVSVVALFREAKITRRLAVIVEGESLLNDGTAIVAFNIALAVALGAAFNPIQAVADFARIALGGIACGAVLGWIVATILVHIDDYLVETTVTTCLAFGAYLVADQLQVSGVLAAAVAGLWVGNFGTKGMTPTGKVMVINFWEFVSFAANSLVFLLIGLTVNISTLLSYLGPILIAVVAVLVSRAVIVYSLWIILRWIRRPLPQIWRHVLFWGAPRGAISLALALSLPANLPGRDTLRVMTFGIVVFTILTQGTTLRWLLGRLGLTRQNTHLTEYDLRVGRLYAAEAAWRRIHELHVDGIISGEIWIDLRAQHLKDKEQLERQIHELYLEHGELEREVALMVRHESLLAERSALGEALQRGLITDEAYRALIAEVDKRFGSTG